MPISPRRASTLAGNHARRSKQGLQATIDWYQELPDKQRYEQSSKKYGLDTVYSVSCDRCLLQG